jgi:large subunit ribosomal protein L4e
MAASRPLVSVYDEKGQSTGKSVVLPAVFRAPIRTDIVNFVHDQMRRNKRQAHAVSDKAGEQTSAESWGTGRAVARIPRVRGGGTHRSGQGAFGNMCRGGRMYAPLKVWRKWHRKINLKQRRYALVSAIAASGVPSLVLARGHSIETVPEVPLVLSDKIQDLKKTKEAVAVLRKVGAWSDILKVYASKHTRAGKGKMRNRRTVMKRGPVIIYDKDNGVKKAFRNIPGVSLLSVERLNLLRMAPGGHVGRFVIWTESAFKKLDALYGTWSKKSQLKVDFNLPQPMMTNSDLGRLLKAFEIQSVLRPPIKRQARRKLKKNPLKNIGLMSRLNPYATVQKRKTLLQQLKGRRTGATSDSKKLARKERTHSSIKTKRLSGVNLVKTKKTEKVGAATKTTTVTTKTKTTAATKSS